MLEKLIAEFEENLIEIKKSADDINKINYYNGIQTGIISCMNIVDFNGTNKYFENSDDLPY